MSLLNLELKSLIGNYCYTLGIECKIYGKNKKLVFANKIENIESLISIEEIKSENDNILNRLIENFNLKKSSKVNDSFDLSYFSFPIISSDNEIFYCIIFPFFEKPFDEKKLNKTFKKRDNEYTKILNTLKALPVFSQDKLSSVEQFINYLFKNYQRNTNAGFVGKALIDELISEKISPLAEQFFNDFIAGIGISDLEGNILYVNNAAIKMWGYNDKKEFIQKHYSEFFVDATKEKFNELLDKGFIINERTGIKKDGTLFTVKQTAGILNNEDGKPDKIISSYIDISDYELMLKKLQSKEKHLKILVETIPDGIEEIDLEGKRVFCNKSFYKMTGYSKRELLKKYFWEISGDSERSIKNFLEIIENKVTSEPFISSIRTKNKGKIDVLINWEYKYNEKNEITGVITIVRDITEQKELEDKLKNSEIKYRALIENSPDIISRFNKDLRIIYISPSIEKYVSTKQNDIINRRIDDLNIPVWIKNDWKGNLNLVFEKNKNLEKEFAFKKDNKQIVFEWRLIPEINEQGKVESVLSIARDITDRKRYENEFHKRQELFTDMFYSHSAIMFILDPGDKGRIIEMNNAAIEFYGFRAEHFPDIHISDINQSPYKDVQKKMKLAKEGRENIFIFKHKLMNGEIRDVEVNSTPIHFEDKTLLFSIIRDITDKIHTTKALEESEEKFRSLFNTMLNGFALHEIICDKTDTPIDYKFLEVNPAFEKLTGLKKKKIIGKRVKKILPETEKFWIERYGKVALSGKPIQFEEYSRELNKYYDVYAYSPKKYFFAVIIRDVTDKVIAKNALIASEKRIRKIIESTHAGYFFVDKNGNYKNVNEAWLNMHGFENKDEIIGKSFLVTQIDEGKEEAEKIVKQLLTEGGVLTGEYSRLRKDRSIGYHLFTVNSIEQDGEIIGIEGFLIDITDRKKLEGEKEELIDELDIALQNSQEANRLKQELLAMMSHEIKTPLSGIIGFTELTLNTLSQNDSFPGIEDFEENLGYIHMSAMRLNEILSNLLELSVLEAGRKPKIELKEFNVKSVIDDIFIIFRERIKENNNTYNIIIKCDEVLFSAHFRIQQILFNLISNALKFTTNGEIKVTVEEINEGYLFKVKDTGIGIDKEKHSSIFNIFEQIETNITQRQFQGVGLGLALCKRLVDEMGGEIWLESKLNKGSTFYFKIPYFKDNDAKVEREESEKKELELPISKMKVLFVDDDKINLQLLEKILNKKENIEAKGFSNSSKFIEHFKNNQNYDLIIVDIQMPDLDGVECLKIIKNIKPKVPVIALTAFTMENDRNRFIKMGFDEYLGKPIDRHELYKMLDDISKHIK